MMVITTAKLRMVRAQARMAHAWRKHGARMAHAWRTHGAHKPPGPIMDPPNFEQISGILGKSAWESI